MWLDGMGRPWPDESDDGNRGYDEVTELTTTKTVIISVPYDRLVDRNECIHTRTLAFYEQDDREFWRLVCRMACTMAEVDEHSPVRLKNKVEQAILNMLGYASFADDYLLPPDEGLALRSYLLTTARKIRPYLYTGCWKELILLHQSPTNLLFSGVIYAAHPGY